MGKPSGDDKEAKRAKARAYRERREREGRKLFNEMFSILPAVGMAIGIAGLVEGAGKPRAEIIDALDSAKALAEQVADLALIAKLDRALSLMRRFPVIDQKQKEPAS